MGGKLRARLAHLIFCAQWHSSPYAIMTLLFQKAFMDSLPNIANRKRSKRIREDSRVPTKSFRRAFISPFGGRNIPKPDNQFKEAVKQFNQIVFSFSWSACDKSQGTKGRGKTSRPVKNAVLLFCFRAKNNSLPMLLSAPLGIFIKGSRQGSKLQPKDSCSWTPASTGVLAKDWSPGPVVQGMQMRYLPLRWRHHHGLPCLFSFASPLCLVFPLSSFVVVVTLVFAPLPLLGSPTLGTFGLPFPVAGQLELFVMFGGRCPCFLILRGQDLQFEGKMGWCSLRHLLEGFYSLHQNIRPPQYLSPQDAV